MSCSLGAMPNRWWVHKRPQVESVWWGDSPPQKLTIASRMFFFLFSNSSWRSG